MLPCRHLSVRRKRHHVRSTKAASLGKEVARQRSAINEVQLSEVSGLLAAPKVEGET